jgi:uncharacterized DUF497 family protein
MDYSWNDNKLLLNLEKHQVHFSYVEQFEWDTASIEPDTRFNYGEPRFIAYGLIDSRLYCLVFTPRNKQIQIISLRKANKREVKRYEYRNENK